MGDRPTDESSEPAPGPNLADVKAAMAVHADIKARFAAIGADIELATRCPHCDEWFPGIHNNCPQCGRNVHLKLP